MLGFNQFSALNGGAFSAGVGARTVAIDGIGNARILICYEGIFAHEVGTDTRPRLLVLITNDAWFGPAAGPKQHLAQARLRASRRAAAASDGCNILQPPRRFSGAFVACDHDRVTWRDGACKGALTPSTRPPKREYNAATTAS